jgi:hypothetical protein
MWNPQMGSGSRFLVQGHERYVRMTSCRRKDVDVGTEVEYVCGGREVMVHMLWRKEVRRGRPIEIDFSPSVRSQVEWIEEISK